MGSWISAPVPETSGATGQSSIRTLRRPPSPPHPSRSDLNPPTSGFGIPYFLPVSRPDLTHSHLSPSLNEVMQVTEVLLNFLPLELVCRVMDEARYWAGCRNLLQKEIEVIAGQRPPRGIGRGWRNGQEGLVGRGEAEGEAEEEEGVKDDDGEVWYLLSEEIGCYGVEDQAASSRPGATLTRRRPGKKDTLRTEGLVEKSEEKEEAGEDHVGAKAPEEVIEPKEPGSWAREIIIETLSRDQGWSSAVRHHPELYGTYEQTSSWFEISLLRNGREVEGSRRSIQNNIHAGQYFKAHRIALGEEDELVKSARKGDRVILWVRAQYPGWMNIVREAAITVYCAPFPL